MKWPHGPELKAVSGAPIKKLPASPSVGLPCVSVADRGGEKVNVGFSDFGAGSGNQLRDPCLGGAGNDREFSLGNEFHSGPPAIAHKGGYVLQSGAEKGQDALPQHIGGGLRHQLLSPRSRLLFQAGVLG